MKRIVICFLTLFLAGCITTQGRYSIIDGMPVKPDIEVSLTKMSRGTILNTIVDDRMDRTDRRNLNQILESIPTGNGVEWTNPDTKIQYFVIPVQTYTTTDRPCRRIEIKAEIDGQLETIEPSACRNDKGEWVL